MVAGGRRTLGAVVLLAGLAVSGCSADAGTPTPSPVPSSSAATPTESPQERQERLDYEAAEKAYRTFRAEFNRVLQAGGAKKATKLMRATADGSYLDEFTDVIEAYAGLGDHQTGNEKIVYVRHAGYSSKELSLEICEDSRATRIVAANGKTIGRGEVRTASLQVRKLDGNWKVWSGTGRRVNSCA